MSEKQGVVLRWFESAKKKHPLTFYRPCEVKKGLALEGVYYTPLYVWRVCNVLARTGFLEAKTGDGKKSLWDNSLRFRFNG